MYSLNRINRIVILDVVLEITTESKTPHEELDLPSLC
jgi:hypothetical protein